MFLEMNKNRNTTSQNLWDAAKLEQVPDSASMEVSSTILHKVILGSRKL